MVPNFEASPHEGFPRDSRETPTSSAALAAPHHRYGARPRGPLSLPSLGAGDASVPQAHAPVAGGRDTRSGGAGGFLPPLRPCRETRLLEEAVA